MNFLNQLRRIERIDILVRTRSTGTPEELARRLNISQSQLYKIIQVMKKHMEAPIYYSRPEQSYCYEENVQFVCTFKKLEV